MDLEHELQILHAKGDMRGAATLAIEGYGPEVLGFLVSLLRDERDAREVFSQTCEDMWIGLTGFQGRCSMRTWLYVLARHAATRYRRSPQGRPGLHMPLSQAGEIAARVPSEPVRHLRTDVKDRFAAIRNDLADDDRALLVLRLDRGLNWLEVARTFSPEDDSDKTLQRVAARLRKRFQALKSEIRERAREAGLIGEEREP